MVRCSPFPRNTLIPYPPTPLSPYPTPLLSVYGLNANLLNPTLNPDHTPLPSKCPLPSGHSATVVLDVNVNVQLFSIAVRGTLLVEDRANAMVRLRTTCITVWPGGVFAVGEPTAPFYGSLEVLLSGDDLTQAPLCKGKDGMTGRYLTVERGGRLSLFGKRPRLPWSHLAATAKAGDWSLRVHGRADWVAGDVLLLAGTSGRHGGVENAVVAGTRTIVGPGDSDETEVLVTRPLREDHMGVEEVHNGHVMQMTAEVSFRSTPLALWPV